MFRHKTQETRFLRVVYPVRFVLCPNVEISLQHNAIEHIAQCSGINAYLFYCLPRRSELLISSIHVLLRFCYRKIVSVKVPALYELELALSSECKKSF
jgi:hypothetical protein